MRLACVCPCPAIDHTMVLPRLAYGETVRAVKSFTTAGGKGLNVARYARSLGARVTAVTWLGEAGADMLVALARRDGLNLIAPVARGLTVRVCPVLVSEVDGSVLVASDPAPVLDAETWQEFVDLAVDAAGNADAVCVSGSFPRVVGLDPVRSLMSAVGSAAPLWVDTSGDALAVVAGAFPAAALKINIAEAGPLAGEAATADGASPRDRALSAAAALADDGRRVVVTAGQAGAAEASASGLRWQDAPAVATKNPTGSGDAYMAGYLCAGRVARAAVDDPLRMGVLAGAANALSWGPVVSSESVVRLAREC